mgnify:CR=1 FL=1
MKPNCRRCYYGGLFVHNRQLASCDCKNVTEPTFIVYDELFKIERQYVHRKNWEDECDCEHFIPHLSEAEGDYELEATCTFNTSFDCPFCGETVYVWDIGIEETAFVTCDECGKQIAVQGKGI